MQALEKFIINTAPPYYPSENAPNSWEGLKEYKGLSPIPVYNGNSENSIFSSPTVNFAARAWHDEIHLTYDLSFSVADEIAVARIQCEHLGIHGLQRYMNVTWCDVVGQILYYEKYNKYVEDQNIFVCRLLKNGVGYLDTKYIKEII